jgi:hypothetical protein
MTLKLCIFNVIQRGKLMDTARLQVRMKEEIHAWLKQQAKANNRSMNGEINELLRHAMKLAAKKTKHNETAA